MPQYREVINVVSVGNDRLTTRLGPLLMQLGKGLSAAGSGRRRFGPLDAEPDSDYIFDVRTVSDLVDALARPATVTVVSGHGGWGTGADWHLGFNTHESLISIGDLCPLVERIPTKMLIVSACQASTAALQWKSLLPGQSVLLAVEGAVQVQDATRWLTTLFSSLAAFPGEKALTYAQLADAFETTRKCLELQEGATGTETKRTEVEPVPQVFQRF